MSHRESIDPFQELLDDPLRLPIVDVAGAIPCHLVGGAIRDRLALGRTAYDWDLIVRDQGEIVARRLARRLNGRLVRLGGKRFAAHRVALGARAVDIWDRQGEPMEQELQRRDLTINSIAIDLATSEILDPTGGRADLDAGVLRANAADRFTEDPLRTLRLLRFALDLPGFRIESQTVGAARSGAQLVETVAAERVREELDRILGRRLDGDFTEVLIALDLFPRLWAPDIAATRYSPSLTVVAEANRRLETLVELTGEPPTPRELAAMHHALLIRAAPFGDADQPPVLLFRQRLDSLVSRRWLVRATAELASTLLELAALPTSDVERRLFVYRHGAAWPIAATIASLVASASDRTRFPLEALETLADLARREGESILGAELLLNGRDLERDYDIEPGPRMGALLDSLRRAQVVGSVRTARGARKWIADQLSRPETDGLDS